MIRRFIATNNTAGPLSVSIVLAPKSDGFLNFRIPYSLHQATVRPHATVNLLSIVKIFPEIGWAEYDIYCSVQKPEGSVSKSRGDNDQNSVKRANFNIRKIDVSKIDTGAEEQKKCRNCEALNSPSYTICKECYLDL